jgi:ketosteroid isomerase-like protein
VAKSFRYSNVRVRVYGEEEFAVMQSWWSQQATIDGREWDGEGLMTDVWVKQEGRWRVVARHSSVPPPQAS